MQTDGVPLREWRRAEAAGPRALHDGHLPRHEQTLHPHGLRTILLRQVPRQPHRVFDRSRRGVITAEDIRDTATRLFLVNNPPQNPSMRWSAPLCLPNIPHFNKDITVEQNSCPITKFFIRAFNRSLLKTQVPNHYPSKDFTLCLINKLSNQIFLLGPTN